ncbi:hypothetical protein DXG01_006300 [Tephrocybe rancida]|nr:hypothetical protein DXG01_006300 [Tephrocybe rancida]
MPLSLLPLLRCPVCNDQFDAPTTLHCGHTVCTKHLRPHSCPVPTCAPHEAAAPPNIPSSSTVAYYPAPTDQPPQTDNSDIPSTSSRIDVTVSKVLDLVARAQRDLEHTHPAALSTPDSDESDDDHSPPATSSRRRSRSDHSQERPRKRRRQYSPDQDEGDPDNDLLSHLVATSARQRSTRHDQPLLPPDPPSAAQISDAILARFEKDLLSELTCEICFTLFYDPITTPFLKAFPAPYRERGEAIDAEERDARLDTPIFVCQLSFPGMPTLLHFFEPRYRLMLRRCLESPHPCFGMVMPPKPGALSPHVEYGTMLEIRSVQMQADGRSLVETWGTYRFRILEIGTLDGYMVGRIERIDDYPEDITEGPPPAANLSDPGQATTTPPSAAPPSEQPHTGASSEEQQPPPPLPLPNHPSNTALMARCRAFLDQLERGTAPWIVQRLSNTYGRMPTDASSFSYWVASILPIDDHEKAKLLPVRSPRLRLVLVAHWIEQLNNNWYTRFSLWRYALLMGLVFLGACAVLGG